MVFLSPSIRKVLQLYNEHLLPDYHSFHHLTLYCLHTDDIIELLRPQTIRNVGEITHVPQYNSFESANKEICGTRKNRESSVIRWPTPKEMSAPIHIKINLGTTMPSHSEDKCYILYLTPQPINFPTSSPPLRPQLKKSCSLQHSMSCRTASPSLQEFNKLTVSSQ